MPVLEKFRHIHPEVSVDILTGMSETDLVRGLCDIAVLTGEPQHPGLVYASRGRNIYLPVASPDYLKRFGLPLTPAQLSEHRGYLYTGPVREETKELMRAGSPTGERAPVAFGTTVRSTDVLAIRGARRVRVFFEWFAQEMRQLFASYEAAVAPIMGLPPDLMKASGRGEIIVSGSAKEGSRKAKR